MRKRAGLSQKRNAFLILLFFILLAILFWLFLSPYPFPFQNRLGKGWKTLTRESKRILGWETGEISLEEQRIREEVILKKMAETSALQDWRTLAPEYPQPKKMESPTAEEKMKALKNSSAFKEMDREVKEYLKKKEEIFYPEPPLPSLTDIPDNLASKDKGEGKVMGRLMSPRGGDSQGKPLEENLRLGMKGPLLMRKILERPSPPPVKVKVEVEIELTLWVLPGGTVDRVVPSVKGDAELERIAIQFLKQWRFAPLPKDQPQVEQWGTLPIKFRLQ